MTDRIVCCVDGCTNSMKNGPGYAEWLCRRHWKASDGDLRARFKEARKGYLAARRSNRKGRTNETYAALHAALMRVGTTWKAIVEDAKIKTAMGVEGTAVGRRGTSP